MWLCSKLTFSTPQVRISRGAPKQPCTRTQGEISKAVQYGTAFSPAVNTAGNPRGSYVTSGIPANAIVQIKTGNGQIINPNTLGTAVWDSKGPSDVPSNMPTIKVTGRAEMPSLEIYHAQLSPSRE